MITEHGTPFPYFASLLTSVCDVHIMTIYDLRVLAQLLLSPSQFKMWEGQWRQGLQVLLCGFATLQ